MSPEKPSIFLATNCYGGQASAAYMRSLLAFRPACGVRGVGLHIELGGGEALIGRARAGMMAKFLASPASHLLFVDSDTDFTPEAVFGLLASGRDVAMTAAQAAIQPGARARSASPSAATGSLAMDRAGLVLISRRAAQRMVESYPQLHAHLGDVQDATAPRAAMVFDPLVHPENRRYLTDQEAFCYRWRVIGDPAENSKSGATRSNR